MNGDFCNEQDIRGYPTINLYSNGKMIDSYLGERTVEALEEFVLEQYNKIHGFTLNDDNNNNNNIDDDTTTTTDIDDDVDEEEEVEEELIDGEVDVTKVENNQQDIDNNSYNDDDINISNIEKINPTGESIVLDVDGLNLVKQSDKPYFVKFYAPWCPHCQHLAPTWEQMAKELKNQVNVGEVNCVDYRDLCFENGVRGFPTLILFKGDKQEVYTGTRSLSSLLSFASSLSGPLIKEVNEAQYNEDLDPNGVAFVYLHKDKSDTERATLETLAEKFKNGVTFYSSTDAKLVRQYELALTDLPVAMIVKDGKHLLYPGRLTNGANIQLLSNWIELEKYPLVISINPMNAMDILKGQRLVVIGFFSSSSNNNDASRDEFRKLAKKRIEQDRRSNSKSDRALFAELDMDTYGESVQSAFHIQKKNLPAFIILDGKNNQYFNRDTKKGLLSMEDPQIILETLNEVIAGNIKGISTLSLTTKLVQHLQFGYHQAQSHSYLTFISFMIVGVLAYRFMIGGSISGRRKNNHKSHILPTTHQD
ncbi:unnamed protein product [Cunninghamella blakesleeana]